MNAWNDSLISFRLRAQFGTDIKANALHGSSTEDSAKEAVKLVFGEEVEYNEDGTVKITGESVSQSISQQVSQCVSQSVSQSASQSVCQPAS